MLRFSAIALFAIMLTGCGWQGIQYKSLRNVEIHIGGCLNAAGAERDAVSFEDQINRQFDSNIKLPRLPFHAGRYINSVIKRDRVMVINIEGEF